MYCGGGNRTDNVAIKVTELYVISSETGFNMEIKHTLVTIAKDMSFGVLVWMCYLILQKIV
jgi:hypothetical protein